MKRKFWNWVKNEGEDTRTLYLTGEISDETWFGDEVTPKIFKDELMAGSGVNPSNVRQLAATGVDAVHFSARSVRPGGMVFRNPHVSMGDCGDVSEYDLLCADERLIRQILTLLEP